MPATENVDCKHEAGVFQPVIDRNRCEGKDDCVRVCPYGVFEVRVTTAEERAPLGPLSRFKLWAHGNRQAFAVKADECHGCGLCVAECPEKAIKLQRRSA